MLPELSKSAIARATFSMQSSALLYGEDRLPAVDGNCASGPGALARRRSAGRQCHQFSEKRWSGRKIQVFPELPQHRETAQHEVGLLFRFDEGAWRLHITSGHMNTTACKP